MTLLHSKLTPADPSFQTNAAAMRALVDELRAISARIARGGPDSAREKHRARGKWLARERIDALLDPGSAFLEIAPLAAYGLYDDEVPCAGVPSRAERIIR